MNNRFKFILLISVILGSFVLSGQAQNITTGLVAYYQFEETSCNEGAPVADAAGTHTGTIVGSGLSSDNETGKIGNYFIFDGTSHISLTATTADITDYPEFTLSAWVYPTTLSSSKTIISKITAGRDFDFKFYNATLQIHHYNSTYRNCNATTASSVNKWIHVLATWKNNEWKVYYNGILESTCSFSSYPILWISNQMYIGSLGSSERFIGRIDEVRVYNRALSEIDVTALYNYSGGGSTPALSVNNISVNNISVNENSGTATFTISMNQTSSQIVSGNYATSNGSATSGSDYTAKSGSFSIPIGQTSATVSVTILDNASAESSETFNLAISNPANATIADASGVCTITDNDGSVTSVNSLTGVIQLNLGLNGNNLSITGGNTIALPYGTGDITEVTAGTGLSGGGSAGSVTLSASTGTALWNANKLQGMTISTSAPSTNQVLKWNGTSWTPSADNTGTGWAQNGANIYFNTGNVGIGTSSPDQKLTVKGKIHAEEVIVDLSVPAPDYVFGDQYKLRATSELEDYLKQNSHLPDVPSAKEMEFNGVSLSVINMALLKKIEELTLYIIDQEKRIKNIEALKLPQK